MVQKTISVIIPCYQNEKNIPDLFVELQKLVDTNTHLNFEFVFVEDASIDDTYNVIQSELESRSGFSSKLIGLVKNVGSYNALLAGMNYATGDCNVHLHSDLQDPPDLIPELVHHWEAGEQLVIAYRENRDDGYVQDVMSNMFHKLIRKYVLKNAPIGGFDLMLFDNDIKNHIINMNENNVHLVYLFIWLNFPYKQIPYTRKKRLVGKSSYTFNKRIKLAFDTFIGFSTIPVQLIWKSGVFLIFIALIGFILSLAFNFNVQYFGLITLLLFLFGMLQVSLGLLGEFIWRILDQGRHRPNYIVKNIFQVGGEN